MKASDKKKQIVAFCKKNNLRCRENGFCINVQYPDSEDFFPCHELFQAKMIVKLKNN